MQKSKLQVLLIVTVAAIALISTTATHTASAHALNILHPNMADPQQMHAKDIFVVLGHTNEPTYGKERGIHDGKHNVEVILTDKATALRLKGADLQVDAYYFKNSTIFDKAKKVVGASYKKLNVPLSEVYGDPGHYVAREVQIPGIYGYRLHGTINYFNVGTVPIDSTVFCSGLVVNGNNVDTSKFNSPGWFGGYGCTEDITDIFFPPWG